MLLFDPQPFTLADFGLSLLTWGITVAALIILALSVCLLTQLVLNGSRGFGIVYGEVNAFFIDLFSLSAKRIGALAKLTFTEAVRRKALLIFVVFGLLFMFAGWFMTDSKQEAEMQVKVHVVFVLTTITWLIMPVILLLSCWGLPEDIRLRSLHTVVTKPARRMEVVLGRILGYTGVGLLVLSVMSVVGYIWISRQVPEEARAELTARRPKWGELTFLDRSGDPTEKGINVGDIDNMRSFIEGGTKARAIWRFTGVTENSFVGAADKSAIVFESRFQAFRSFKGNMDRSLMYQYYLCNKKTGLKVPCKFTVLKEFHYNIDTIPRKLSAPSASVVGLTEGVGKTIGTQVEFDVLKDIVTDGTLVVEVLGIDRQQYLGMSRPDLFIRLPDASFAIGYFKSVVGIGLTLFLVVVLGVTASTFVKGPVATLSVFTLVAIGHWDRARLFLVNLTDELMRKGEVSGGGLLESVYKILAHMNPTTPLPEGPAFLIMKKIDFLFFSFLWLVRQIIPNFEHFNKMPQYVSNGFDVPFASTLLPSALMTFGFFFPCIVIGFYALRLRELEAK